MCCEAPLRLCVKLRVISKVSAKSFSQTFMLMLPLFQLFAEMYIEDPLFVCEVGHSFAVDEDPGAARKPVSEKQTQMVSFWSRLLEIISLRHRIMESSWESEVRHCSCCCNRAIISSHFRLNFRFSCLLVITLSDFH